MMKVSFLAQKISKEEVLNKSLAELQDILFPHEKHGFVKDSFNTLDIQMLIQLDEFLLEEKVYEKFKVYVCGSALDNLTDANDLDLVLVKKENIKISLKEVEKALIIVRHFGLKKLNCILELFYQNIDSTSQIQKANSGKCFYLWLLSSPNFKHSFGAVNQNNRFKNYGKLHIISRSLDHASYYHKLPLNKLNRKRELRNPISLKRFISINLDKA